MNKQIKSPLYRRYAEKVAPELRKEFKLDSNYAVAEIKKVVVNTGVNSAKDEKTVLEEAVENLRQITGQKPVITRAKKSISNFSLKQGDPVGCMVTLRGERMYEFIRKLLSVAIPRIRDFGGLKRSIDKFGNLTLGLRDESIFPEVNDDTLKTVKGLNITIVTDKQDRKLSERLYEQLGFPFEK
ncbi:MAG: 50S ribosomal protein L5 [Elusimicrobiota bacterium]